MYGNSLRDIFNQSFQPKTCFFIHFFVVQSHSSTFLKIGINLNDLSTVQTLHCVWEKKNKYKKKLDDRENAHECEKKEPKVGIGVGGAANESEPYHARVSSAVVA